MPSNDNNNHTTGLGIFNAHWTFTHAPAVPLSPSSVNSLSQSGLHWSGGGAQVTGNPGGGGGGSNPNLSLQDDIDGSWAPPPINPFNLTASEITESHELYRDMTERKNGKKYNRTVAKLWHPVSEPVTGDIGLEIECEGENLPGNLMSEVWTCHEDGSLRMYKGVHKPVEYVLRKPLKRYKMDKALKYLSDKLRDKSALVVKSPRTSVHVHINVLDLTLKQALTFAMLYYTVEDLLVDYGGKDRVGNMFCLRTKDAAHALSILENCIRNDSWSDIVNENLRYTSCNLAALSKFGSLEFRSMRGTTDPETILEWVDILLMIKERASLLSNPIEILNKFNEGSPKQFLKWVFPEARFFNLFKDYGELDHSIWDAIRSIRDLAYASTWEEDKPDVTKVKKQIRKFNPISGDIDSQWTLVDESEE